MTTVIAMDLPVLKARQDSETRLREPKHDHETGSRNGLRKRTPETDSGNELRIRDPETGPGNGTRKRALPSMGPAQRGARNRGHGRPHRHGYDEHADADNADDAYACAEDADA
jgi:hypothetical protein